MVDVEQTDAVGSSQGQDVAGTSSASSEAVASTSSGLTGAVAGTSSGATGVVACANKPVGIVAPQKRVAVPSNAAAPASRARNGTAVIAGPSVFADMPPIVAQAQRNIIAQARPFPFQPRAAGPSAAPAAPQPPIDAQPAGNRRFVRDREKYKFVQRELFLYLHSNECQRPENQRVNGEAAQPCSMPHCRTVKNVLNHMVTCNAGRTCTVPHCNILRPLIGHWVCCTRVDCLVCPPPKQAERTRHTISNSTVNFSEFSYTPYVRFVVGNEGITIYQAPPSGQQAVAVNRAVTVNPQQQQPEVEEPAAVDGAPTVDPLRQQNEAVGPATADEAASNVRITNRLPNPPQTARMQLVLPNPAVPMQRNKEWQQTMTPRLRNHIVLRLVKSALPTPDPQATLDRRMLNIITMCKRVEQNLYEEANSRSEYYHLVAQKMYKFQKELEEKRKQRFQHRQQMQDQPPIRAAPAHRVNPIGHLKRSKPLLKIARTLPKPIGTVRPTLRMFIRVHSNGMRVLQNRTGARQSSNGQSTSNLPRSSATTGAASNGTVAPIQAGTSSASTEPRPSENEPLAGTSASNTPPVEPIASASQVNPTEERRFSIQRCVESLVHACQCKTATCDLPSCQRMKRVIQHIKTCQRRTSFGCPICKQLVALCCLHARQCEEACPVPFCFNIKQKLKQQQRHQRVEEAQRIRRRSTGSTESVPAAAGSPIRLFRPKSAAIRSRLLRSMRTRSQGLE